MPAGREVLAEQKPPVPDHSRKQEQVGNGPGQRHDPRPYPRKLHGGSSVSRRAPLRSRAPSRRTDREPLKP